MVTKISAAVCPLLSWRVAVGNAGKESPVALLEFGYAKTLSETRAAKVGGAPPHSLAFGLTAQQCRVLAADLVAAANKTEAGAAKL